MNHLLDHAAHAVLRGAIYRVVFHTDPIVLAVVVGVVVLYMVRRYP